MKKTIGNLQLSALIFAGIVGLSLDIPKDFGRYSGTGGWMVAVINTPIVLIPGLMIISLNMKKEEKPFYEYLEDIRGRGREERQKLQEDKERKPCEV